MSKASLSAFLVAFLACQLPVSAQEVPPQEPGHEGHNHPPGQGHEAPAPAKPDVPTGPVRLTAIGAERVELTAGLIGSRFELNRTVTLPALYSHCDSNGFIQNFAIAAGKAKG